MYSSNIIGKKIGRYGDLPRNANGKMRRKDWMNDEVKKKRTIVEQSSHQLNWNLADYFWLFTPSFVWEHLSRIVARKDRLRNLSTLAIQAITPWFAELLLYFLHANTRRVIPTHLRRGWGGGGVRKGWQSRRTWRLIPGWQVCVKVLEPFFCFTGSFEDPHHFDADQDAYPDSDFYLMRIQIRVFNLMRNRIQILASK